MTTQTPCTTQAIHAAPRRAPLPSMGDAPLMFRLIHAVFRVDATHVADAAARLAAGEHTLLEPLRDHLDVLSAALHEHHSGEDELIFPVLLERRPDMCSELLVVESEHTVLDEAVEALRVALDLADPALAASSAFELVRVLNGHLDHEERVAVPIWLDVFTDAEMAELEVLMQERGKHLTATLLPWVGSVAPRDLWNEVWGEFPLVAKGLYLLRWQPKYRRRPAARI
jgi:hypothetical protein